MISSTSFLQNTQRFRTLYGPKMSGLRATNLLSRRGSRAINAIFSPAHSAQLARQYGGIRQINYGPGPQTVFSTEFWKNLIPKPLRSDNPMKLRKKKSKDWNPATFYIVIFLFIGSMSIQMIAMRRNFENFMRQSDVRIALLREVVEKLQKGETVDVEQALGVGDRQKEQEWEDVLREIENSTPKPKSKRQKKQASSEPAAVEDNGENSEPKPRRTSSAEFF
ncbi:hypothetical protein MCOR25_003941 [Pyricularia grisea]|uniref:Uncharacterized protein n=1 Tax=Pyricularia grisea TaxID=148305 RepID=A0A6P8AS31_PYRGI|nr:uncharacterized protein PgNI_10007 [Pyricularia grisea]KAI6371661.1 hypothetical protein MCOR25_003941 [Pyricularia grisea]TLD04934.1 hypothetical protein PgNI_10007 [Pyricularia grisea]